jgi:hypothetical protein
MKGNAIQGHAGSGAFPWVAVDTAGALVLSGTVGPLACAASYDSAIDASSGIVLAAPCTVLEIHGYNSSANERYFQLFNLAAVPADGAVPVMMPVRVLPGSHFSLTFSAGRLFSVGCSWASSSTRATKTVTLAGDMTINVQRRP